MAKEKNQSSQNLRLGIIRLTRTTYFFIALSALSLIIYDAGNLYERSAVIRRFGLLTVLLIITTLTWVGAKRLKAELQLQTLIWPLIIIEIVSAGLIIYWERGMASMSTLLYALPIISVAVMKSRIALMTTASFCVASYSFATVKYFNDFFNEGYRIQLWGQVIFFSGLFFILAWLVMVAVGIRKDQQ